MRHNYTQEQRDFIKSNVAGRTGRELTKLVNEEFGISLSESMINSYKKNNKLKSGLSGCFKKGCIPLNKGKKHPTGYRNSGQFKKGRLPHNHLPVGSERVDGDGYIDIKIADPDKWKAKHRILWEEVNGPIPDGHAVIFADRDTRNFDIDNLLCLSKLQLINMNRHNLIKENAELTKTGLVIADIYGKIADRKRK